MQSSTVGLAEACTSSPESGTMVSKFSSTTTGWVFDQAHVPFARRTLARREGTGYISCTR